ncbi:rhodanese-like domain-containing protein [Desulfuribacillus alkaliarsenatis]|uniref:Rhodanese domain-containing protein n=1 Tax=Desulfuribacillus alkaliarsenatis TaxID=766136 RepID=A0A1E5G1U6_9FIRM|nr:rhodanese-like domain-containing protein [Desulfuribacillus alkaliarsenatis]OEF96960.1 hypothetical protein BHF68_04970 [Desulfuribacillus alkaliarsenatis]
MKKTLYLTVLLAVSIALIFTGCGQSTTTNPEGEEIPFNYISTSEFRAMIDAGDLESGKIIAVCSQTEAEFAESSVPGAIVTHARPLETADDFAKLNPALEAINTSDAKVVILCPRGGSGATRPFEYFMENGVDTDRLLILQGGVEAFAIDYPDYVVTQ